MWWFMLGCVAFSVCCHAGSADKSMISPTCVLNTAFDLAAAALCIARRVGLSQMGVIYCRVCGKERRVVAYGL